MIYLTYKIWHQNTHVASQGRPEGSLFISYNTEWKEKAFFLILIFFHLPLICIL